MIFKYNSNSSFFWYRFDHWEYGVVVMVPRWLFATFIETLLASKKVKEIIRDNSLQQP